MLKVDLTAQEPMRPQRIDLPGAPRQGNAPVAGVAGATVAPATDIYGTSAVAGPAGAHHVEKRNEPTRPAVGDGAALDLRSCRDVTI